MIYRTEHSSEMLNQLLSPQDQFQKLNDQLLLNPNHQSVSLFIGTIVVEGPSNQMENEVAKKSKKKIVRREYTKADVKELRAHSKAETPIAKIIKLTKRTEGSLRQKALKLGIRLGHRR